MGAQGTVEVDFGTGGAQFASVAVTGQTGILAGSAAEAWVMAEASTDHTDGEQMIVPMDVRCSDVVAGTGFTIRCTGEFPLTGKWKLRWVWN